MARENVGHVGKAPRRGASAWGALMLALVAPGCIEGAEDAGEASASEAPESGAGAAAEARVEKGGAVNTCFNWRASGWGALGGPNSVTADCRNYAGQLVTSEVWLPVCMGNAWGNLVYGGQWFDRSCGNCGLHTEFRPERYRFVCDCDRGDGSFQQTNIPISDYLTNYDGQLYCD